MKILGLIFATNLVLVMLCCLGAYLETMAAPEHAEQLVYGEAAARWR